MKKFFSLFLVSLFLIALTACGGAESELNPDDPVTLTMWHVYGEQADSPMNHLVSEFNETVGLESGIVLEVTAMSNGSQIGEKLLNAQSGKPGEPDLPDLFFCHTSNALDLGAENLIDWNDWFSKDELKNYVPEFLEEGLVDGRQLVFPVSKSTHLLFVNGTEFSRFSEATGVSLEDLSTWSGFFSTAAKYYEWSGGKTFCAMDFPLRAMELSMMSRGEAVPLKEDGWYDFESSSLHDAWQPFAVSMVQGHIGVSDLFANTQIMTGEVAAGLGSSAAILYYNDVVTYPDNTTEPMNLQILPMPQAEGGESFVTQAGVGLAARATTSQKAEAASVFAHWLTEPERNLEFVAETGYMPVNIDSFDAIDSYEFTDKSYKALYSTLKTVRETSTSVIEPSQPGYYGNVAAFYDALRAQQSQWEQRAASGESPETLADENWALFSSIS